MSIGAEKQAPVADDFTPLTDFERRIQQRILSQDLANIPPEFWAAVNRQLEQNRPRLLVSEMSGIKGEEWREVNATGQPQFTNAWTHYDARVASFYKDAGGRVEFEGVVKDGTINTAIFTLPEGYWPRLGTKIFVVDNNTVFGRVSIDTAGVVRHHGASNAYLCLDGISFRAA